MNIKQAIAFLKTKGYEVRLGRSSASKVLLIVSDIHVGNINAVCSYQPTVANTGQYYRLPKRNHMLLEHWIDCRDWCQNPHIMIINGEPIDGPNKKEAGGDTWSHDPNDQIDDAERLLRMHNPTRYVFTRGSNYHVKDGQMSYEEILARRLNALGYNPDADVKNVKHAKVNRIGAHERYVEYYLWFKILDQICSFTHHTSYTSKHGQRANAISNEMTALEFDRGWYYPIDSSIAIVGRGHVHYYTEVRSPSTIGFTTPCIPEKSSWVYTDLGPKLIEHINIGDIVLTHTGRHSKVKQIHNREYNGDIYNIKSRNMPLMRLTPEHPVLARMCIRNGTTKRCRKFSEPIWIDAQNIKPGDIILHAIPNEINDVESITPEHMRLFGYYLAEGSVCGRSKGDAKHTAYPNGSGLKFTFHKKEFDYMNDVKYLTMHNYDLVARIVERNDSDAADVSVNSVKITAQFVKTFGMGVHKKTIPHWIMLLPLDKQAELIKGVFRGDGTTSLNRYKLTLSNRELIYQIRILLLRQGITTTFCIEKGGYGGMIKGRRLVRDNAYTLTVECESDTKIMNKIMGLNVKKRVYNSGRRVWITEDGYFNTPVSSVVKEGYRGNVYNIGVDGDNSYTLDSGSVHNCWKLPDGFLFRNGIGGTRPHIGAVKVIIEPNGEISVDKLLSKAKFPKPAIPDWTNL